MPSTVSGHADRQPRLQRWLARLIVLAGLLFVVGGASVESVSVPWGRDRLPAAPVVALGATLILAGVLARRASPRALLALAVSSHALLVVGALSYRPPERGDVIRSLASGSGEIARVWTGPDSWHDEYRVLDARYGVRGIANARSRHHTPDFDVEYSFDDQGWRRMPEPSQSPARGELAFLGCSLTFGVGVEDDATFSAWLAREAWTSYRVRNYAHGGWGTTQAWLVLDELLARDDRPRAVFHGWMPHHLVRNARRKSYFHARGWPFPAFELTAEGGLKSLGLLPVTEANEPDGAAQDALEIQITRALVRSMHDRCRAAGVPCFTLLLQNYAADVLDQLFAGLEAEIINLGQQLPMRYFPNDRHPDAHWHQDAARLLAADERIATAIGDSDLHQPAAIPRPPVGFTLSLVGPAARGIVRDAPDGAAARITGIQCPPGDRFGVRLWVSQIPIRAGCPARLRLVARADAERPISIALTHSPALDDGFGIDEREYRLSRAWQPIEFELNSPVDDEDAVFQIALSASPVPVEIQSAEFLAQDQPPLPIVLPPRPTEAK